MSSRYIVFLLVLGILTSSCNEQDLLEPDTVDSVSEDLSDDVLSLLDQQGKVSAPLSEDFGQYRIVVNVPGAWTLHSNNAFVQLDREAGCGCDTLCMMVGRNWSESREAQLVLTTDSLHPEAATRRLSVRQQANHNLSTVASKINSSMGAGYSYCPADCFTMGTGIQIFNMNQFPALQSAYGSNLMTDDYYPSLETSIYTSDSLSELQSNLKIQVSADVDLKMFTLNFEGGYTESNVSRGNRTYAAQRLNSTMFSREVHYMNALALAEEHPELRTRIFSSGFLLMQDNLVAEINATNDYETRLSLCRSFIKSVGPCFISKSLMGCSMDYWISVEKSSLDNNMDIEALLKFKWESTFSINVDAEGSYSESQKKLRNETQANFDIRGGQVQEVSILTTGGTLEYIKLKQWLLDVDPENAVLVNMHLEPIYLLFVDRTTQNALRDYLNNWTK